ncbi:MAG: hypothetical protein QXI20_02100 [Candidatus Jordarchaeales archaeon]
MLIRKYTFLGMPVYVAIITDEDVSDIDEVVLNVLRPWRDKGISSFSEVRELVTELQTTLSKVYERAEGIAIVCFPDKACVSSLWGDFMNHQMCRDELYNLINIMVKI